MQTFLSRGSLSFALGQLDNEYQKVAMDRVEKMVERVQPALATDKRNNHMGLDPNNG
ncbi:hypothetical protein H8B06_10255 [Sphingobacterium sp. DN00404]|uniref:Uncharacterized protein n=1 Tax=Sphingobacterium micropteri TaxID=2763501 RepID=A0ABR7YPE9_9SPHI|nr:hypothetical protein [Sphingobacterium micropteri]MBD1433209.1 hypothetical protein [Sphingobacterium micropteri]